MHDAVALLLALIFLVVSFFVALIAPKGKRKLLWLFIWFLVFFADGFITSAIFHYYENLRQDKHPRKARYQRILCRRKEIRSMVSRFR